MTGAFNRLYVCGGEYPEQIMPPEDPTAFILGHPYLDADEPKAVTVDGHEGVQIDAAVIGSPPDRESFKIGVRRAKRGLGALSLPEGAGVRIICVEVDDAMFWMVTVATLEGFEQAVEFSEGIIAGIDFH